MNTAVESHTQKGVVAKILAPAVITLEEQVDVVVSNYVRAHPNAPEDAVVTFRGLIQERIATSGLKAAKVKIAQDKALREARAAKLNDVAQQYNIQFKSVRSRVYQEEVLTGLAIQDYLSEELSEEDVKLFGNVEIVRPSYPVANKGGATIAYIFRTDAKNQLFADYAVSVCREDENFDGLYGREKAVERLLAKEIATLQVAHCGMSIGKFSDEEFRSIVRNYRNKFFQEANA